MCRFGDIRLRGGANSSEGRVEICYDDNQWGTVCDDEWGSADANVACRQLGFSPTGLLHAHVIYFIDGTYAASKYSPQEQLLFHLHCLARELVPSS